MPSGITSKIYDGKEVSLRDYLNTVGRSLTLGVHQRDESYDSPVRLREVNSYDLNRLAEAQARVIELEDMTQAEVNEAADASYQEAHKRWSEGKVKQAALRSRYEGMLSQVHAWECPEIIAYVKEYAIRYLEESIEFDCHDKEFEAKYNPEPQRQDPMVWYAKEKESAAKDVGYRTERLAEEEQRVAEFNEHIEAFLGSLP